MSKLNRDERSRLVQVAQSGDRGSCCGPEYNYAAEDRTRDRLVKRRLVRRGPEEIVETENGAHVRRRYFATPSGLRVVARWRGENRYPFSVAEVFVTNTRLW